MRVDEFTANSGLVDLPEMTDDGRRVLIAKAGAFFEAGGTITLSDWYQMNEETKAAFITARRLLSEHVAGSSATPVSAEKPAVDGQQQ
jgi:hypothetical protein